LKQVTKKVVLILHLLLLLTCNFSSSTLFIFFFFFPLPNQPSYNPTTPIQIPKHYRSKSVNNVGTQKSRFEKHEDSRNLDPNPDSTTAKKENASLNSDRTTQKMRRKEN
jgi:hypothetical protein